MRRAWAGEVLGTFFPELHDLNGHGGVHVGGDGLVGFAVEPVTQFLEIIQVLGAHEVLDVFVCSCVEAANEGANVFGRGFPADVASE